MQNFFTCFQRIQVAEARQRQGRLNRSCSHCHQQAPTRSPSFGFLIQACHYCWLHIDKSRVCVFSPLTRIDSTQRKSLETQREGLQKTGKCYVTTPCRHMYKVDYVYCTLTILKSYFLYKNSKIFRKTKNAKECHLELTQKLYRVF